MGLLEFVNGILNVMRDGGIAELVNTLPFQDHQRFVIDEINRQEAQDFSFRALNDPTSGSGLGGFGQTGPATLKEQRRLDMIAAENDTTLPYAGL